MIYIDCGANFGQGYELMKQTFQFDSLTKIHLFEPNPYCLKVLHAKYETPAVTIHDRAAWNRDETRTLNIEFCPIERDYVGGATNVLQENFKRPSNVLPEHMSEWPAQKSIQVVCVDFSRFVFEQARLDKMLIVKLDIEGAEIEVLDKMISDDTLKYLRYLFVEWHFHMRKDRARDKSYYLGEFAKHNILYREWH